MFIFISVNSVYDTHTKVLNSAFYIKTAFISLWCSRARLICLIALEFTWSFHDLMQFRKLALDS